MDAEVLGAALIVLGVVISALELVAPGLIVLPFGLGAILAGVAGVLGAPPMIQIVIFIIGLLATVVMINVLPSQDRAMVTKAKADIATLETALEQYRLDNLTYPASTDGLNALSTPPPALAQPVLIDGLTMFQEAGAGMPFLATRHFPFSQFSAEAAK